jgi:hypothetical protein
MLSFFGDPMVTTSVLYPEKWQGFARFRTGAGPKGTVLYLPATSA